MKQKFTTSRAANRGPSITASYPYGVPVFFRRVRDILGADHKSFSAKHPRLDGAVEGMKARLALQEKTETKTDKKRS